MSTCNVCEIKITRNRPLSINDNTCSECFPKIKDNNYNLKLSDAIIVYDDNTDDKPDKESEINDTPDMVFIKGSGKNIPLIYDNELDIELEPDNFVETKHDFKNALLASLYSQVEFLRNESEEKNAINNNNIKLLHDEIEFLREELREKNVLIKMLMDTNNENNRQGKSIPIVNTSYADKSCAPMKIVDYDDSDVEDETENNIQGRSTDLNSTPVDISKHRYTLSSTQVSTPTNDSSSSTHEDTSLGSFNDGRYLYADRYKWEKHSSGVASRILNKMGFSGKGLGKTENGITEPITTCNMGTFHQSKSVKDEGSNRKLLYVLSSSMLNQMDGERLSNNDVEVRVQCHGGCTIRCLYSHLPNVISSKPEYILLHIGSNDCSNKTSDEVLNEMKKLLHHLKLLLPLCIIILSLPLVRSDNKTAAAVQKNLNVKMRKLFYPFLDNSNITHDHLGKKGLHLNGHGTKKMARNIICLIKRL